MPKRCEWAKGFKKMLDYHDKEWGVPIHDDVTHFEFITLEGAQAGLSWATVLKKREAYRKAFSNFDPQKIAKFKPDKVERLLENSQIIRNRLKIASTIANAKAFLKVQKDFGSFDNYIWSFVDSRQIVNRHKSMQTVPAKTELSNKISKDLKKRGFKFVGATIVYSYMQAVGIVNDHLMTCEFR